MRDKEKIKFGKNVLSNIYVAVREEKGGNTHEAEGSC